MPNSHPTNAARFHSFAPIPLPPFLCPNPELNHGDTESAEPEYRSSVLSVSPWLIPIRARRRLAFG